MKLTDIYRLCYGAIQEPHGWVGRGKTEQVNCRCGGPAMCRHCLLEEMFPVINQLMIEKGVPTEIATGHAIPPLEHLDYEP